MYLPVVKQNSVHNTYIYMPRIHFVISEQKDTHSNVITWPHDDTFICKTFFFPSVIHSSLKSKTGYMFRLEQAIIRPCDCNKCDTSNIYNTVIHCSCNVNKLPRYIYSINWDGWSTPRPGRFNPGNDPVPYVQEAGWAPGPVWTDAEIIASTGIRSPDRPHRSESLSRLSYPGPPSYLSTE